MSWQRHGPSRRVTLDLHPDGRWTVTAHVWGGGAGGYDWRKPPIAQGRAEDPERLAAIVQALSDAVASVVGEG